MNNATQTNTQEGDLVFLANEDLTGCEGYLLKLVNDAGVTKVALPDAITDMCPFVLIEAGDEDENVIVRPLQPNRNVRLKLYGTCNPGDILIPNADGTHDGMAYVKPDATSACHIAAVAEQIGVDGQLVLSRPLMGRQYPTTAHFLGAQADDSGVVEGDIWYNTTSHLLKFRDNSAVRVLAYLAALVLAFCLSALVLNQMAMAADVTPAKVTGTTSLGSVAGADNFKVPGTLEVTGVATFTAAPVFTDAATSRTNLGLAISTNVQAYDADLTTYGGITPSANVQSLLGATDYSNARTLLGVETAVTEGSLPNSSVVSADIKDGEIVNADVNASAAIANTKLAVPAIRTISQAIAVTDFTDNTNTTGYIDLGSQIPTRSIVLGWKADVTAGFTGDTTATFMVGKSGDTDAFSADTAQDGFGIAVLGSNALAAASFTTAATTPRVTVTGSADFTSIKTAAAGTATITIYYIQTE